VTNKEIISLGVKAPSLWKVDNASKVLQAKQTRKMLAKGD
jgi:hypothetical protein